MSLDQRMLLVHVRLRWTHPSLDDEGLGDLYDLGSSLVDYARAMVRVVDDKSDAPDKRDDTGDGFSTLVTALAGADDRSRQVDVLSGVMFDDPDLTLDALAQAMG